MRSALKYATVATILIGANAQTTEEVLNVTEPIVVDTGRNFTISAQSVLNSEDNLSLRIAMNATNLNLT